MLATLTSHHNLGQAGACVYDPEQSRVEQDYGDLFLTVFQVPLHQHGGAPEGGDASGGEQ